MFPSRSNDRLLWILRGSAAISGIVVLFILLYLVLGAWPALRNLGLSRFFFDEGWHPTEDVYNLSPMLLGTLAVSFGAVALATPLGIGAAVFCNSYAPAPVASLYRGMIALMAGIPSVIYGFWGLVTFVPLVARFVPHGQNLFAGCVILALMILPTIALIADASIARASKEYQQSSAALGLDRWRTLRRVVIPAAGSGITAGIFLAAARAIGETMAVIMVTGNVVRVPDELFQPTRTLTANIALEMAYAMGDHRSALFVSGLALFVMTLVLTIVAQFFGKVRSHV